METNSCQRFLPISKSLRRTPCKRYSNFEHGFERVCTAVTVMMPRVCVCSDIRLQSCDERNTAAPSVSDDAVMYRPTIDLRMRQESRCPDGRAPVVLFGATLTLLIHLLLISPLMFSGGHPQRIHNEQEGGWMSGVPAMTVVSLEDSVDEQAEQGRESEASLEALVLPEHALVPTGSFRPSTGAAPRLDLDVSRSAQDGPPSDDGENALLFGRYLGQVTARIERAWLRPRDPIGASSFECLVQVEQGRDRSVKEITLKRCNGTTEWQLSLVRAIQAASPFPAPPDPKVFSSTLSFEMTASEFVAGGSGEGYEPAARTPGWVP